MTKDEQLDALRIENVRLIDENTALKAQLALTWEGLVTSVCWNYPHGPHGCGGNNRQGDGTVCTFCVPKRRDKEGAGMTDEQLTDGTLDKWEKVLEGRGNSIYGAIAVQLLAEVRRLRSENRRQLREIELLKAVAATGHDLIESLQTQVNHLHDPEHPIRISRREMMGLPLETRRRVMERMAEQFMSQNVGQSDATSDALNEDSCVQNADAKAAGRTQEGAA